MYGLGDRDKTKEMEERYNSMVNIFSDILSCGRWDIEALFDSKNNIEVGEIVKRWVEEFGELPDWNTVYREALLDFAAENDLKVGVDVDIYTNFCMNTSIYAREGLDEEIKEKLEDLFGMEARELVA